ncbi:MAG: hypothetical protein J7J87_01060 [Candidatus Diapherotrites archaeon]|nr:hypothetical protein [Candidatus Diapherotrites archaeon]
MLGKKPSEKELRIMQIKRTLRQRGLEAELRAKLERELWELTHRRVTPKRKPLRRRTMPR